MFDRPPPREITSLIIFLQEREWNSIKSKCTTGCCTKRNFNIKRDTEKKKRIDTYQVGDKVLIKNRQLPSSIEGIARKLLLLYTGPYIIAQVKGNNTYEITAINNNRIKGVYNQSEMKRYHEE